MVTPPPQDIEIGPDGIRLGQFLKYAGLVETGGEAKDLLAAGLVLVNGVSDGRRGAQLVPGDVVTLDGRAYRLV